jgi:hypothetical protein
MNCFDFNRCSGMGTAVLSCFEALMGHWLTEGGNKERTLGVKREKSWGSEGAFFVCSHKLSNYGSALLK